MRTYRVGRFEVSGRAELVRTALGAALLIGLGEPALSASARFAPRRDAHKLARLLASGLRRFLALNGDVTGLENVEPDEQYVVAPLHEGFADALLLALLPLDLRYVARDELLEWPQLGRLLASSGQIVVTPENRVAGLRHMLAEANRTFYRGESLVMFPQGSILGVEASFTSGAFRIADRLERPLLPVVITGTHRVWEHPYSDRLRFGQPVTMRVLEPLPVGEATRLMGSVQTRMKSIALSAQTAPVRRFDPDRDGYWDGYSYEIDATFPDVAAKVAWHRALIS